MDDGFDAFMEQEYEDRQNGGLDFADPDPDPMDDGGDVEDSGPEDCEGDCADCEAREDCEAAGGYPDWADMPNEDMDGDHQTALRDAGFGTDEDYGDFGGGLED